LGKIGRSVPLWTSGVWSNGGFAAGIPDRSDLLLADLGPMTFPQPVIQRECCQISESTVDLSQIDRLLPDATGRFRAR
jgi:hypothetical protein